MPRKRYSAVFKSRVATEALKGQKSISEIASEYEVHPNQVSKWKRKLQDGMPDIFSDSSRSNRAEEELTDKLYQEIGRLKVELDWLKKKL
jgi:transposase-like protein